MISYLSGTIHAKEKNKIILLTQGGVGYEMFVTPQHVNDLNIGNKLSLHTYLKVSESAMDLYGFASENEKHFFELLLTVSGIGPKGALNVLALGSIDEIKSAIARKDVKYLTAVQGMGKKTAERVVVELQAKLVKEVEQKSDLEDTGMIADVIDGLMSMGYNRAEAKQAVQNMEVKGKSSEILLREALRKMSKA